MSYNVIDGYEALAAVPQKPVSKYSCCHDIPTSVRGMQLLDCGGCLTRLLTLLEYKAHGLAVSLRALCVRVSGSGCRSLPQEVHHVCCLGATVVADGRDDARRLRPTPAVVQCRLRCWLCLAFHPISMTNMEHRR
jgi:hypothetical protein